MDTFRQVKKLIVEKLQLASKRKQKDFGQYADECWKYYSESTHDFLYGSADAVALSGFGLAGDCPRVTVNKSFEMVDVFLPYLHHRNPTRMRTDRRPKIDPMLRIASLPQEYIQYVATQLAAQSMGIPPQMMQADPMAMQAAQAAGQQMMASGQVQQFLAQAMAEKSGVDDAKWKIGSILMESVLNYTPNEFDLQIDSRRGLTEALVAGRGVWWSEMIAGPHGLLPGTVHVEVDKFLVDPDFYTARDWEWCARERVAPKWRFAQQFGIPEEDIKCGYDESTAQQAAINIAGRKSERDSEGGTHDLVRYWEYYSRCGLGGHLSGADPDLHDQLRSAGDNVLLIITDSLDEPANLREEMLTGVTGPERDDALRTIKEGLQWPLPFWKDSSHPWPFALCDFHHQNKSAWPVSHLRPALGEQRMLDWIWSHVAAKIKKSASTKWLYRSDMDENTRDLVSSAIDHLWVPVRMRGDQTMRDMVFQMDAAPMNRDLFEVAQYFEHMFEMRTGVSALLSMGESSRQMRSSYEAQLKEKIIQSRPEAMADVYEETQARAARNECIALRRIRAGEMGKFFHEPLVAGPNGEPGQLGPTCQLWEANVYSDDDDFIMAETDARVESGSMRKPNIGEALTGLTEFTQVMLQPLMASYQLTGDPTNMNILLGQLCQKTQMPIMALPDMRQMMAEQAAAQQQQPPQKGAA